MTRIARAETLIFTGIPKDGKYLFMDVTCAILAGGMSSRMGKDKATIEVCERSLIGHVYEKARSVFSKILIVSSRHDGIPGIEAPIVADIFPVRSSIVGIASALLAANTPYVFVLACDMPFVTPLSIGHVINEMHGEDIVIPRTRYGYEALHAVYGRSCLSVMLNHIARLRLKVTGLFPYLSIREVPEHPAFDNDGVSVFTNINAEEDLSLMQRLDRR